MARLPFALVAALALSAAPALAGDGPKKIDFTEPCARNPEACGVIDDALVHAPQLMYVLGRFDQEDLETLELKEEFLPSILRSVNERPF